MQIIHKFKKNIKGIINNKQNHNLNRYMNANILSMAIIKDLLSEDYRRYIPFTDYSLKPYTVAHILNDLLINRRKNIVEFGSGTSTIYIALFMKMYNFGQEFNSFDEDKKWQDTLKDNYLNEIALAKNQEINMNYALLKKNNYGKVDGSKWYDCEIVNSMVGENPIDCIIVDGPKSTINKYARYPVINFIVNNISETGVVFIDDISREDEKAIVDDLINIHGFKSRNCLYHSILYKNEGFYTDPIGKKIY